MAEPKLERVTGSFTVCSACLDGEGGECHTAGCVFWLMRAPDLSLRANLLMHDCRIEDLEARASVSGAPVPPSGPEREPRRGCSVCGVTSLCRHIMDGSGSWVDLGRRNEDTRPNAGIVCLVCMTRPATRYATAADGTGFALCAECRLDDEARGLGDAWLKDYADTVAAPAPVAGPRCPKESADCTGGLCGACGFWHCMSHLRDGARFTTELAACPCVPVPSAPGVSAGGEGTETP